MIGTKGGSEWGVVRQFVPMDSPFALAATASRGLPGGCSGVLKTRAADFRVDELPLQRKSSESPQGVRKGPARPRVRVDVQAALQAAVDAVKGQPGTLEEALGDAHAAVLRRMQEKAAGTLGDDDCILPDSVSVAAAADKDARRHLFLLLATAVPLLSIDSAVGEDGTRLISFKIDPRLGPLTALLGEDDARALLVFAAACTHLGDEEAVFDVSVNGPAVASALPEDAEGRAARSQLHRTLNKALGKAFAVTIKPVKAAAEADDAPSARKRARADARALDIAVVFRRAPRAKDIPLHRFKLELCNMETNNALHAITRKLKVGPHAITCAGTKDRRAVTTQFVTIRGDISQRAERIVNRAFPKPQPLDDDFDRKYMHTSEWTPVEEALAPGDLRGNRFTIVARQLKGSPDDWDAACAAVRDVGFLNYFGPQRFGHPLADGTVPGVLTGAAMLRGDWIAAVRSLLAPHPTSDFPDTIAALNDVLETRSPESIAVAIKTLPASAPPARRAVLTSLRRSGWRDGGGEDEQQDCRDALMAIPFHPRSFLVSIFLSLVFNTMLSNRITHGGTRVLAGDYVRSADDVVRVVDPSLHKTTDILLPVLGTASSSEHVDLWGGRQVLDKYGVDLAAAQEHLRAIQVNLSGTWRNAVVKPADFEHRVDVDAAALHLAFSLPPSAYATMLFRELTGGSSELVEAGK